MGEPPRTTARFPGVATADGHYESFYVKAAHPSEPLAIWLRHTVHKRPGGAPRGALWLTLFDGREEGPWAVKETRDDVGAGHDRYIDVGDSRLEPGRARGSASAEGRSASWELTFESAAEPLRHLPREWMYRVGLPRTKLLSPYPDARFSGHVTAGDRAVELDGWRGMVGHNWGAQHAERWIWIHGAGFAGRDDAWIDVGIGRVALGPWTTPWVANGVLFLDGARHRLGGLGAVRRTEVAEAPDGCSFTLPGREITVQGRVGAPRKGFVGWIYADPDGSRHDTVNCSIADMTLAVSRPAQPPLTLELTGGAAYELGMRETDHGIPLQPFSDG